MCRIRHQHLFEGNVRKTKKRKYADFKNKGSGVVYA